MYVATKGQTIDPEKVVNQIVFVWLGRMRWLPHLGAAYYVVGHRDNHVIAVSTKEGDRGSDRVYIHQDDLALVCDPYDAFTKIKQLKKQHAKERAALDTSMARTLRAMANDTDPDKYIRRKRTRPAHRVDYPRTAALGVA
jgi:hypothetical protein